MFRSILRSNPVLPLIISLLAMFINALVIQNAVLGLLTMVALALAVSKYLGPLLLPDHEPMSQMAVGFIGFVSSMIFIGSLVYYLTPIYMVTMLGLVAIIALLSAIAGRRYLPQTDATQDRSGKMWPQIVTGVAIVLCLAAWWNVIGGVTITESIRSPWLNIDPIVCLALGIPTLLLMVWSQSAWRSRLIGLFTALVLFSAVSIAVVIYPLGYGFDPFVHRATIAHIAEHGTISPKPLYYTGEYVLELIGSLAFSLPLDQLDRWLLPVLAVILLSSSALVGFGSLLSERRYTATLSLLLLPLGAYISTTPQSLAYALTGAALFLSLPRLAEKEGPRPIIIILLALSALATHPLAGIPAMIYLIMWWIATWPTPKLMLKKITLSAVALLGSMTLPLVFIAQATWSGLVMNFTPESIFTFSRLNLTGFLANRYSTWLDGLYLFVDNQLWWLVLLAILGLFFIWRYRAPRTIALPALAGLMCFVNFWLLSTTLEFSFLIEYERTNYADRLLTMTMIFLAPLVGIALAGLTEHLRTRPRIISGVLAVIFALMVSANIYGAYPRHDNYARSAGYNVAKVDYDAVYAIYDQAQGTDYIVLANQAVAAAALESFGFYRYYHEDIFYYPIPTGGELYHHFLEMVGDEPTREAALTAMDTAGVDTLFLVVNDYWWQAERVCEHAKLAADDWFAVGDGAVTIFRYDRSPVDTQP